MADPFIVSEAMESRKKKVGFQSTFEMLGLLLIEPLPRKQIIQQLAEEFLSSPRTIETRLSQIINNQHVFDDADSNKVTLCKRSEGKEVIYYLNPIK